MPELSALFRFDNEPVQMVNSTTTFKDFDIFTKKEISPSSGNVVFPIWRTYDYRFKMKARNYRITEILPHQTGCGYGKMYGAPSSTLRGAMPSRWGQHEYIERNRFTYYERTSTVNAAGSWRLSSALWHCGSGKTINGVAMAWISPWRCILTNAVRTPSISPDGSNYMLLRSDTNTNTPPRWKCCWTDATLAHQRWINMRIPVVPTQDIPTSKAAAM